MAKFKKRPLVEDWEFDEAIDCFFKDQGHGARVLMRRNDFLAEFEPADDEAKEILNALGIPE